MEIDIMEYIIGFIAIVVIIIYYIGMVVWQDTMTRRFQKIIKTAEIESIKVYEGKYFVKMKFYGEGYFTLEGNHVDIVSVGHVINMKNGQLLYTPQNDDTEYISMTQKDY